MNDYKFYLQTNITNNANKIDKTYHPNSTNTYQTTQQPFKLMNFSNQTHQHHQPQHQHHPYPPTQKYLYILIPDSGPGNQIIAIKEALIIAKYLNRTLIIPDLHNHYLINLNFIKFKDIYSLTISEPSITDYTPRYFNHKNLIVFACKKERFNIRLISYKTLSKSHYKEYLLRSFILNDKKDINRLNELDQDLLILKDLFGNLRVSECGFNGCIHCPLFKPFQKDYEYVCSHLDFSPTIKKLGESFLNEHLNTNPFIAFHLRYPDDIKDTETLSEYTKNEYNEYKMVDAILETYNTNNDNQNQFKLFIATNKPNRLKQLIKTDSKYKCIVYNTLKSDYNGWIEQYICTKANIFISFPVNMYDYIKKPHKCSTFSSFITDYRNYFLKLPKSKSINILDIYNPTT